MIRLNTKLTAPMLTLFSASFIAGCGYDEVDFESMEVSERESLFRQQDQLLAFMPLEKVFVDVRARTLAEAAANGEVDLVRSLVADGVDVNVRGTDNATPLYWALRNIDGFRVLLELGADPNVVMGGTSVIHQAAGHADITFLVEALNHGGDPNIRAGQFHETPLFAAMMPGYNSRDRNAVELLLKAGAEISAELSGEAFGEPLPKQTPVTQAALLKRYDLVYLFLSSDAGPTIDNVSQISLRDHIAADESTFLPDSEARIWFEKVKRLVLME